jgi:hypothetical protein
MPTPEQDALTDALTWAAGEDSDSTLAGVSFRWGPGRSTCEWTVRFTRTVRNGDAQGGDDHQTRFLMIIQTWLEAFAKKE